MTDFQKVVVNKFRFLTEELGFEEPYLNFDKSSYRDTITYKKNKLRIEIQNQYHPYDYGLEINLISSNKSKKNMIYYVLREDQDNKFIFLDEGVRKVKNFLNHKRPRRDPSCH